MSASKQPSDSTLSGTQKGRQHRTEFEAQKAAKQIERFPTLHADWTAVRAKEPFKRPPDSSNSAENSAHSQGCCLRGSFTRLMNREISTDTVLMDRRRERKANDWLKEVTVPFSWALQSTSMQQTVDTMQSAVTKAI